MAQNNILEEVFKSLDEYFASQNDDIIKGLTIGIELETKGRSFYLAKYQEFKNDVFNFLADDELQHLKALENVKEIIERRGQWVEVRKVQLKNLGRPKLFEGGQTEPKIADESSTRSILLAALSAESKSEEFYNRMAEKVKDEDAKKFFTALANLERRHFEIIRNQLPKEKEGGVISRFTEGRVHKHTRSRRFH
ncbi:MAG: hypothetical protein QG670_1780 [Thermoproteota archaeon]|nr:hypothetical protein [Thermoproteota archaeon]